MADKNKNGIDDSLEKFQPGQTVKNQGILGTSVKRAPEAKQDPGLVPFLASMLNTPARAGLNFVGDVGRTILGIPKGSVGTGVGDQLLGTTPGAYNDWNSKAPQPSPTETTYKDPLNTPQGTQYRETPDLLSYLSQGQQLMDAIGLGKGVDYSPAVNNANSQFGRNDAYLQAIYNQLRSGLKGSQADENAATQGAIDRSQQIASTAQGAIGQAANAAAAKQAADAAALGVSGALVSQNAERPGVAEKGAGAIADSAAKAQNAQTLYNSQGRNAVAHDVQVGNASQFAEADARANLGASLSKRLSDLAIQQAQANNEAQNNRGNFLLSLIGQLRGADASSNQAYNTIQSNLLQTAMKTGQAGNTGAGGLNGMDNMIATLADQYGYDKNNLSLDDAQKLMNLARTYGSYYGYTKP